MANISSLEWALQNWDDRFSWHADAERKSNNSTYARSNYVLGTEDYSCNTIHSSSCFEVRGVTGILRVVLQLERMIQYVYRADEDTRG